MAPTLWLVRHAPTRDNLDGVIMGQRDPEPDPDALRDAAGVAPGVTFARAVSSDARRAVETASAIAPHVPARLDERLRERCFGEWEGRDKTSLRAAHPDVFTVGGAIRLDVDPPGAEPLTALLERVYLALVDMASPHPSADLREAARPVLVVAHNGSLRAALVLLGMTDIETATTMSLDYLSPYVADLATLRVPDSLA